MSGFYSVVVLPPTRPGWHYHPYSPFVRARLPPLRRPTEYRGLARGPARAHRGVQTILLVAALFALGTAVHLPSLVRGSGMGLVVGTISTIWVTASCLAGVLLLA